MAASARATSGACSLAQIRDSHSPKAMNSITARRGSGLVTVAVPADVQRQHERGDRDPQHGDLPEGTVHPAPATARGHDHPACAADSDADPITGRTGFINLDALFNPSDQCLAYALAFLESDEERDAGARAVG